MDDIAVAADAAYEVDYVAWTQTQAEALRQAGAAGLNAPVDWANVAEEIESLGRSDVRSLRGHIETIIEHLVKLEWSPAVEPRRGWTDTVRRARRRARLLLRDSPSLVRMVADLVAEEECEARAVVADQLLAAAEIDLPAAARLRASRYPAGQVVEDEWLPPVPAPRI